MGGRICGVNVVACLKVCHLLYSLSPSLYLILITLPTGKAKMQGQEEINDALVQGGMQEDENHRLRSELFITISVKTLIWVFCCFIVPSDFQC
jgi:hypothetical protein